ncbi:MAG TPA: acetyltransferase [Acidimicrobiia bacterium]|jgi:sugar O-acyltransferase (sialic acid O-acetyltransferase NeuD family)|nr:acetyltransferase [Acidimicrobiia bacterium]
MARLVVIGAGGHGKVVVATAQALGWTVTVADDDRANWGGQLLGVPVDGPVAPVLADTTATCVLAIGSNAVRARLARGARCAFATLVHPAAVVHASVVLGAGTVVFAGAIIQPDTRLGAHGIVNTGASIDHDCALGSAVHIAPGARLAGGVTVGDEAFVGIGAVAIPGVHIGARATIGAGAAVVRDVPADAVAVGVPARPRTIG